MNYCLDLVWVLMNITLQNVDLMYLDKYFVLNITLKIFVSQTKKLLFLKKN